jgi:hypothetical protein
VAYAGYTFSETAFLVIGRWVIVGAYATARAGEALTVLPSVYDGI